MKITTVNYQKVFPLGQYVNERIGVEIQCDGLESPEDCLITAKSMVERFHKENNPHLYQETTPIYNANDDFPEVPPPENTQDNLTVPEKIIAQLKKCNSINDPNTGLKTWELIVQKNEKQYPEVRVEYDRLINELSK